tara:strand:+ start:323 stop:655 length:333 start_codon:yes stop_codon:yes gene_type:complete
MAATGFRLPKKTARLLFHDDYEGAEVVVRLDVPLGRFLEIQDLIDDGKQLLVFEVFGESVIDDWNLQDNEGKPLPPNGTGMKGLPIELANLILTEWSEVAVQAPDPLGES